MPRQKGETVLEALLVFITAGSQDEADRIAAALLDARLVACVNQVADLRSDYWWQGAREHAEEILLLAKTRRELWPQVLDTVRATHSYEVFEALAVPIIECNPSYLQWIAESTTPAIES
jgi:periplasmic divalent cation tolerance protein